MPSAIPPSVPIDELLALPAPEKLAIIGALWDSIDQASADLPIPDWQMAELNRREAADMTAPEPTVSWDEAQQLIRAEHAHPRSA